MAERLDRGSEAARASSTRAVARRTGRHALMAGHGAGGRGADGRLSWCLLDGCGAGMQQAGGCVSVPARWARRRKAGAHVGM